MLMIHEFLKFSEMQLHSFNNTPMLNTKIHFLLFNCYFFSDISFLPGWLPVVADLKYEIKYKIKIIYVTFNKFILSDPKSVWIQDF